MTSSSHPEWAGSGGEEFVPEDWEQLAEEVPEEDEDLVPGEEAPAEDEMEEEMRKKEEERIEALENTSFPA